MTAESIRPEPAPLRQPVMTATGARNWAATIAHTSGRVLRPESVAELSRTVAASRRLRVHGSGHSFSEVAVADGDVLVFDRLSRRIEVDRGARLLHVDGGARYRDVVAALDQAGLALPNLASLPHITIAGACATGTHGSGSRLGGLATAVSGLRLVGPDGGLVRFDRDADELPGAVVCLGALGVVLGVTLDLEPAYQVAQTVRVGVDLDDVEDQLGTVLDAAYSVSVFSDLTSGRANVFLKSRTDEGCPSWQGGFPADRPLAPVPDHSPEGCTQQLGRPGPWYDRLPHFAGELPEMGEELQSEFFVARPDGAVALGAVRSVADRLRGVLEICEVRSVRADDLWLSPAYRRDSVTLHFTWRKDPGAVMAAVAEVENALAPFDARPHWAKLTQRTADDIGRHYQRLADFGRLADRLDPDGKFRNPFVRSLLGSAVRHPVGDAVRTVGRTGSLDSVGP